MTIDKIIASLNNLLYHNIFNNFKYLFIWSLLEKPSPHEGTLGIPRNRVISLLSDG